MRNRMKSAVLATLAMLLLLGGAPAHAQTAAQREQSVTRAVIDVLRAEEQGDVNRLYDLMAPEARGIMPRQAMANWLADPDRMSLDGAPEIISITFGDWESDLTGDVFEDVAFVEYTMPGAAGQPAEMLLWNDGQQWRWFFTGMDADIEDVAAADGWSVNYESPYRTEMFRNIDMFWAQMFANAGLEYHPPVDMVGIVVQPTQTGCGLEKEIEEMAVYYCTLDETIYYDPGFRDELVEGIGEYAWEHVIAHEWGHHVQKLLGLSTTRDPELLGGQYTIEHELQADCLSGVFGQDARTRGLIRSGDLAEAIDVIGIAGDARGTTWDDESAHGSAAQREQSFWLGYDDGLIGCHISLKAAG